MFFYGALVGVVIVVVVMIAVMGVLLIIRRRKRRRAAALRRAAIASNVVTNDTLVTGSAAPAQTGAPPQQRQGPLEAELYISPYAMELQEVLRSDPGSFVVPMGNVIIRSEGKSSPSLPQTQARTATSDDDPSHTRSVPVGPGPSPHSHGPDEDEGDVLARLGSEYTVISVAEDGELSRDYSVTEFITAAASETPLSLSAASRQSRAHAFGPPTPARRGSTIVHADPVNNGPERSLPADATLTTPLGQPLLPQRRPSVPDTQSHHRSPTPVHVPTSTSAMNPDATTSPPGTTQKLQDTEPMGEAAHKKRVAVHRTHHRHHLEKGGYVVVLRSVTDDSASPPHPDRTGADPNHPQVARQGDHNDTTNVQPGREHDSATLDPSAAAAKPHVERLFLQRRPSTLVYGRAHYTGTEETSKEDSDSK